MKEKIKSISRIAVKGFKSIYDEQAIEIKPLTILAGANSSGKSSMMQPLLLLKQTFEAPADPGALLLDGPNCQFTSTDQILNRRPVNNADRAFSVRIELSNKNSIESTFSKNSMPGFEVQRTDCKASQDFFSIKRKMSSKELLACLPSGYKKMTQGMVARVSRERSFLYTEFFRGEHTLNQQPSFGDPGERGDLRFLPHTEFVNLITSVIHLPGLRGNPRRNYPMTSAGPAYVGTIDSYTASIINQWQAEKSSKLKELAECLTQLGLSSRIKAKPVDDTRIEIQVGRLSRSESGRPDDMVSIADVGFGVSQALPVLVAILVARPGQLVYLEQPEIHLHPRAQRNMAAIICQAAKRDVKIVVETHSYLLLREIQTLVASGKLAPELVALHWFTRDEQGHTTVSTAELDDDGAYGDWPEDFDQNDLEAEQTYLDVLEAKQLKKRLCKKVAKK